MLTSEHGKNISGGEWNKIAILRAINRGCNILVCDEMFSSFDEQAKNDINEFIFNDKALTVIFVTHDLSPKNLKYYDEIIVMKAGEILQTSSVKNFLRGKPELIRW